MADDLTKLFERFRGDVITHVDSGIRGVRDEITTLREENSSLRTEVVSMGEGVGAVRAELREEISGLRRDILSHFDALYARFDRLDDEYQSLAAATARLETRSLSRADFEREIEQLRSKVHHLEHRLDELEKSHREN